MTGDRFWLRSIPVAAAAYSVIAITGRGGVSLLGWAGANGAIGTDVISDGVVWVTGGISPALRTDRSIETGGGRNLFLAFSLADAWPI